MGRIYGKGKGISGKTLPYKNAPPSWLKTTAAQVVEEICNLAKKGVPPSQIGATLRDSKGIGRVRTLTGKSIVRILRAHGLEEALPEDLYFLIKKAVGIRKHLERSRKDKSGKYHLMLIESRIHRLSRYYKRTKRLEPSWKYESKSAGALVA